MTPYLFNPTVKRTDGLTFTANIRIVYTARCVIAGRSCFVTEITNKPRQ